MADPIIYQVDQLTLTDTHLVHRETIVPYASVGRTTIGERRPLLPVAFTAALGCLLSCSARWWGAGLVGPRLSLKLGILAAIPFATLAVFGFTYKVSCLQLWIDGRARTVLKRKDRYPLEVAQQVIETAKRTYGITDRGAAHHPAGELRSDLNPL